MNNLFQRLVYSVIFFGSTFLYASEIKIENKDSQIIYGKIMFVGVPETSNKNPVLVNLKTENNAFSKKVLGNFTNQIAQSEPLVSLPFKLIVGRILDLEIDSYDVAYVVLSDTQDFTDFTALETGKGAYFISFAFKDKVPSNRKLDIILSKDTVQIKEDNQIPKTLKFSSELPYLLYLPLDIIDAKLIKDYVSDPSRNVSELPRKLLRRS